MSFSTDPKHATHLDNLEGEVFFEHDGQRYVGDFSSCDCGAQCAVNVANVVDSLTRIRFRQLKNYPFQILVDADGNETCEQCNKGVMT